MARTCCASSRRRSSAWWPGGTATSPTPRTRCRRRCVARRRPVAGRRLPDNPLGWLVRVASRRMVDQFRHDDARRRREDLAASWSMTPPDPASGRDDTLILMFLCCHPSLHPNAAIPLTLRAVGGLTTREIAAAFLVPEATWDNASAAPRRRSKRRELVRAAVRPTRRTAPAARAARALRDVQRGLRDERRAQLTRTDLSSEAIRLPRVVRRRTPRRPRGHRAARTHAAHGCVDARTHDADGELVPLSEQDRVAVGSALDRRGRRAHHRRARRRHELGEYQIQAAIAAVHDQAARYDDTNWAEIVPLYNLLERTTDNPMVTLNRASPPRWSGPAAGLATLDGLDDAARRPPPPAFRARAPPRAGRRHRGRDRRVPRRGRRAPRTAASSSTSPPRRRGSRRFGASRLRPCRGWLIGSDVPVNASRADAARSNDSRRPRWPSSGAQLCDFARRVRSRTEPEPRHSPRCGRRATP